MRAGVFGFLLFVNFLGFQTFAQETISQKDLQRLNEFLTTKKGLNYFCGAQKSLPWCALMEELAIERGPRVRKAREAVPPFVARNIPALQKISYRNLILNLRRVKAAALLQMTDKIISTTDCPRNFSAASLRRFETLLPSKAAEEAMNKLYEHAAVCMKPGEDGYSVMHLRQSLLRKMWNDPEGARQSIEKAALDTDAEEAARVRFWAGNISAKPETRTEMWNALMKAKPLSFHAALAARLTDTDLKSEIVSPPSDRKVGPDIQKTSVDGALKWFKVLLENSYQQAAANLALELVRNHPGELSPTNLIFVADSVSAYSGNLQAFSILNEVLNSQPQYLSTQVLQLLYPRPYDEIISKNSVGLDSFLLFGLVRQESAFNPMARSNRNARGLMQILPSTARRIDARLAKNLFNVENNTAIGSKYLGQLIDRFSDTELALAAYNAGEGRVDEWLERYSTSDKILFLDLIPFRETRNYVSSILRNNYWYHRLYEDESKKIQEAAEKSSAFKKSSIIRFLKGEGPMLTFREQPL